MNPHNEKLGQLFDQLAVQFKRDRWRTRAYKTAAVFIRRHPDSIRSGRQAQDEIRGIGDSIGRKIDEFLDSGKLDIIEMRPEEDKNRDRVTGIFEGIHGVGGVTAEKWYDSGLRSLEDVKTIYDQLTDTQKLGYCYYHHLKKRIPRKEMDKIAAIVTSTIKSLNAEVTICGSYRRGEADSGDIDCLVKGNISIRRILRGLIKRKFIVGHLAIGETKYMGICRINEKYCARRIDILIVSEDSWPYATLYFTGSKRLNILMRGEAHKHRMTMNEHRMIGPNGAVLAKTEKDIFDALGMKYLKPTERSIGKK